jgi:hypothetical protein
MCNLNNIKIIAAITFLFVSTNCYAVDPFPNGLGEKIRAVKPEDAKALLCRGKVPTVEPNATVVFSYPKTLPGTPIDKVAEKNAETLATVRLLLKRGYYSGYYFDATHEEINVYRDATGRYGGDPTIEHLWSAFTFRIPIKILDTVFEAHNALFWKNFGYDHDSVTWKASKAMEDASWIWQNFLYRMTKITESANQDGTITFSVKLSLSLFCETSVAVADLQSK